MIGKHTGQRQGEQDELEDRGPVVDRSVLDSYRALQRAGAPDFIGELVTAYLAQSSAIMKSLGSAVDEKNTENMFRLAHKLKSSSASVGAMRLSGLLKGLELLGRQNEVEGTADMFANIQKEFAAVQEALKPSIPEGIGGQGADNG
jgi:two-component system, sensor histidine kinase and response regulator